MPAGNSINRREFEILYSKLPWKRLNCIFKWIVSIHTYAIFNAAVESINNSWPSMGHPISFVDWFAKFIECIIRAKHIHIQHRWQIVIFVDFQVVIVFFNFWIIHNFIGVTDMRGHRMQFVECRLFSFVVHPIDIFQNLFKFLTNSIHHFQSECFWILSEIFADIQRTNGYWQTIVEYEMCKNKLNGRISECDKQFHINCVDFLLKFTFHLRYQCILSNALLVPACRSQLCCTPIVVYASHSLGKSSRKQWHATSYNWQ